MKTLIISEIKKICKKQSFIVLLLGLSCFTGYLVWTSYQSEMSFTDYKQQDALLHQYQGQWSEEKYQQIKVDFVEKMHEYLNHQLDDTRMKDEYGEQYQDIIDMYKNGELNIDNIESILEKYGVSTDRYYLDDNNQVHLFTYYQDDDQIRLLHHTFGIRTDINYEDLTLDNVDAYFESSSIDHFHTMVLKHQVPQEDKEFNQEDDETRINEKDYMIYLKNIEDNLKDAPDTFDSNIPNNMYFRIIGREDFPVLLMTLFVIVIVFANIFGIERETNMEQILFPTKATKYKIVFAKWITVSLISILMMLSQFFITFIISYIVFPIHTWNMLASDIEISVSIVSAYTYLDILFITILLNCVAALATATLTTTISYLCKNKFQTVLIMIVFLIICSADYILSMSWPLNWPLNLFQPNEMLSLIRYIIPQFTQVIELTHILFGNTMIPYWLIVSIFWIVIFLITLLCHLKSAKRNQLYQL